MALILSLAENIYTSISRPVLLVLSEFGFGRRSAASALWIYARLTCSVSPPAFVLNGTQGVTSFYRKGNDFGSVSLKSVSGINSRPLSWSLEWKAHLKLGHVNHFTSVHVLTFLTPSVSTVLLGEKSSTSVLQIMTRPLQRKMWSGWPSRSWPEWPSCIATAWCTWILK